MLNWIVWNKTVFDIETAYLHKTELFEIELFMCKYIFGIKLLTIVDIWSNQTKPKSTGRNTKTEETHLPLEIK